MSIEFTTLLLFGSLFLIFATGLPIAFALGSVAMIYTLLLWGPKHLYIAATSAFGQSESLTLIAIPMFILMGYILQTSGVADNMFDCIHKWSGQIRGGLAMGTVVICTLFAACCGVSGAATVAMATIALPAMLKRGYDKHIAIGCVAAGGLLGLLIPPSVEMIIYGNVTGVSVGKMYWGGLIPGLILSSLYITYIGVRSALQPSLCPALLREEMPTWRERFISLRSLVPVIILIILILGGMYRGIFTPTEGSFVGAIGAVICAAIYRNLRWKVIKESLIKTLRISSMVMWIVITVSCFSNIYSALGAQELALKIASRMPGGGYGVIIIMQLSLIFLGMIMDDFAVILIFAPIYAPIVQLLGFDPLWFGILFMVNIQMAWLTPPYGFNLFYMRGAVPKGITMVDIYRSVIPFIGLQFICLVLVLRFPILATWLPNLLIRR